MSLALAMQRPASTDGIRELALDELDAVSGALSIEGGGFSLEMGGGAFHVDAGGYGFSYVSLSTSGSTVIAVRTPNDVYTMTL